MIYDPLGGSQSDHKWTFVYKISRPIADLARRVHLTRMIYDEWIRLTLPVIGGLFLSGCDGSWMKQTVRMPDGSTYVTLEHRSFGEFRTTVYNLKGKVTVSSSGPDSRHVNLYWSPLGRLIVADYHTRPVVFDLQMNKKPVQAPNALWREEYLNASLWRYLGTVRRTPDSTLEWFPREPECQSWGDAGLRPIRSVTPCLDANYLGL